jgi:hypothetical protein
MRFHRPHLAKNDSCAAALPVTWLPVLDFTGNGVNQACCCVSLRLACGDLFQVGHLMGSLEGSEAPLPGAHIIRSSWSRYTSGIPESG